MSTYSMYMPAAHIRQANHGNPGRPSSTQRQRFAFRLLAAEDLAMLDLPEGDLNKLLH